MSDFAISAAPPSSALPKVCTPKFDIACRLSVLRTLAEMLSALLTPLETKPRIKASPIWPAPTKPMVLFSDGKYSF